jgi:hypothetical protein
MWIPVPLLQVETVGQNEVWIRGRTNQEDYRVGKAYTVRYANQVV